MYLTASLTTVRDKFSRYFRHVSATNERVAVTFHGEEQVALVPMRDLQRLEEADAATERSLKARHEMQMRAWRRMQGQPE